MFWTLITIVLLALGLLLWAAHSVFCRAKRWRVEATRLLLQHHKVNSLQTHQGKKKYINIVFQGGGQSPSKVQANRRVSPDFAQTLLGLCKNFASHTLIKVPGTLIKVWEAKCWQSPSKVFAKSESNRLCSDFAQTLLGLCPDFARPPAELCPQR